MLRNVTLGSGTFELDKLVLRGRCKLSGDNSGKSSTDGDSGGGSTTTDSDGVCEVLAIVEEKVLSCLTLLANDDWRRCGMISRSNTKS